MLKDIGHPFAKGRKVYDITFENVQAGERTSHLFRLANLHGGLVVGTGDLSELALGWATYGVGDHMSHYNVNASVPKTLIQYLIGWVAELEASSTRRRRSARCSACSATEISPELVPGSQKTESSGRALRAAGLQPLLPLRFGYAPVEDRLPRLRTPGRASTAWPRSASGWACSSSASSRPASSSAARVPNAPKVGSGGSLSPRGDWRAPSDGNAEVWLADLKRVPAK